MAPFAALDRPATGLVFLADGTLIVSGGSPGQAPGVIWRVTRDGQVSVVAEIAEAAFLNGMTPLGDRVLVCDSLGAAVWACEPSSGTVQRWLADELLAPPGQGAIPGANGIKRFGDSITVSVTGREQLIRAPIEGDAAGRPLVWAENLRADDFCFDSAGAAYIATHPEQSLVRLMPDGSRTTLAGAAQGMVGSTAVAFGRTKADQHSVYVTTTGGTWMLSEDQLEPAKLVRVEVGQTGHPLLPGAA